MMCRMSTKSSTINTVPCWVAIAAVLRVWLGARGARPLPQPDDQLRSGERPAEEVPLRHIAVVALEQSVISSTICVGETPYVRVSASSLSGSARSASECAETFRDKVNDAS